MEERLEEMRGSRFRVRGAEQLEHENGVLGDRKGIIANGLTVPARNARKAVRDVGQLHIDGGRVKNIEAATRQHALPGT
ncbi:hypothetical protein D3C87_1969080 [compost metagenome]